ncbi:hypothetical protein [Streptococcus respiraculi]|uniref:hypothetical protein n=1 Tax=Streptococcus respiraculi TaxID=2021971 RepID=UPI000E734051|nr:hypothetical protein [Streptococcus respiraculi]
MDNYIYQQVICSRDFLEQYFIDYYPTYEDKCLDPPYISFNRLMRVSNLVEYQEKYGEYIYYGYGFSYREISDGKYIVKFATKREYPIAAINQAIAIDSTIEWYAVEENCSYISKFYWNHGVKEAIELLMDDFFIWIEKHYELDDSLSDEDHIAWYYLQNRKAFWIPFPDDLNLPRFYKSIDKKEERLVTEENITYLEARVGGFQDPSVYASMDVQNNEVRYSNIVKWETDKTTLRVSAWKMNRFLKKLKRCHLFDWDLEYPNYLDIIDGTWWEVSYVVDGKKVVKSGDNYFPDEWEKFCESVSELTGQDFS